jgi:hypothetical protein
MLELPLQERNSVQAIHAPRALVGLRGSLRQAAGDRAITVAAKSSFESTLRHHRLNCLNKGNIDRGHLADPHTVGGGFCL